MELRLRILLVILPLAAGLAVTAVAVTHQELLRHDAEFHAGALDAAPGTGA